MIIGYARVSKADKQDTKAQINILESAGAEIIFHEKASGGRWDRPELKRMLDQLRIGDVILVWKLDRLGRNLRHLIMLLDDLQAVGVAFVSLQEGIDATTPAGRLQLHVLGAIAEFERARIAERVKAGLARARAQGKRLGRPRTRPACIDVPGGTVREAARSWGVSKSTAARWITAGRLAVRSANRLGRKVKC